MESSCPLTATPSRAEKGLNQTLTSTTPCQMSAQKASGSLHICQCHHQANDVGLGWRQLFSPPENTRKWANKSQGLTDLVSLPLYQSFCSSGPFGQQTQSCPSVLIHNTDRAEKGFKRHSAGTNTWTTHFPRY